MNLSASLDSWAQNLQHQEVRVHKTLSEEATYYISSFSALTRPSFGMIMLGMHVQSNKYLVDTHVKHEYSDHVWFGTRRQVLHVAHSVTLITFVLSARVRHFGHIPTLKSVGVCPPNSHVKHSRQTHLCRPFVRTSRSPTHR